METRICTISLITAMLSVSICYGQPIADFEMPDTVKAGFPVHITNLTNGGSTFYWNQCSGDPARTPLGVNIGNPCYMLNVPTYISLAKDGNTCYSFISNQFSGVIRYNHGSSFANDPINCTQIGTMGVLGNHVEGIQIISENGNWYGFICNYNELVRMDFGQSLSNTPQPVVLGPYPMTMAHGLNFLKEEGNWIAFIACTESSNLIRLEFGNSLVNTPVCTDFGSFNGTFCGGPMFFISENDEWYSLSSGWSSSAGENVLYRLKFGTSLLNYPVVENLGDPGGYSWAGGITVVRDCFRTAGFYVNYETAGSIGKLLFPEGIAGPVNGELLGNIGGLDQPHSFSEIFRQNDTLFCYVTNRGNNTLTRFTYVPDTIINPSHNYNPPDAVYPVPGIYNVHLTVNESMPDMATTCKQLVVMPVNNGINDPPASENISFPTSFTPNGDGINDFFLPQNTDLDHFSLKIYDISGKKIFSTDNPKKGWDGTTGAGPVLPGIFLFQARWEKDCGKNSTASGTLILIR